jgi:hypothetical protein
MYFFQYSPHGKIFHIKFVVRKEVILTPWSRILFEQLIVTQILEKYPFFMEPEGSLPCSQKPATGPYPEPAESSSPHPYIKDKDKLRPCALTKYHVMKTSLLLKNQVKETYCGVEVQLHATAALPPRYPLNTLLGRPRSWPGRDGEEKRNPYPARN